MSLISVLAGRQQGSSSRSFTLAGVRCWNIYKLGMDGGLAVISHCRPTQSAGAPHDLETRA